MKRHLFAILILPLLIFLCLSLGCSGSDNPTDPNDGGGGGGGGDDGGGGGGGGDDGHSPRIISLSSPSGRPDEVLNIFGERFGSRQESGEVRVGDIVADILSWSDLDISITIPDDIGLKNIKVFQNDLLSNEIPFLILDDDYTFKPYKTTSITSSNMAPSSTFGSMSVCQSDSAIYIAWCGYSTFGVFLTRSIDGGTTFSAPIRVDTGNQSVGSRADYVNMTTGSNDAVAIAWRDYRLDLPHDGEIYLSVSSDGSAFNELGTVSSGSLYVTKSFPATTINPDNGDITTFWRELRMGIPYLISRTYSLENSAFGNEAVALSGATDGDDPRFVALIDSSGVNYILWAASGIYLSDNSSGTNFSTPKRIDLSPASEFIISKPDAVLSNEKIFFAYSDPRNISPPRYSDSPRTVFLSSYDTATDSTLFDISLYQKTNTDSRIVSLMESADHAIHAAIISREPNSLSYDSFITYREYRDDALRNAVEIARFDETYALESVGLALDKFHQPIVLWGIRQFASGGNIYIASP